MLSRLRRPGARAFARSHRLGAALVVLLLLGISTTGVPLGPTPELRAPARPPTPSLPSPAVAAATGPTPANATGYPAGVWTNATNATGPSPRQGAAMVFVPWANEFVLFGGWYRTMSNFQSTLLNDTWTFGNGVWTNITATAGAAPSPREGAALIADPVTQTLFLLGGRGYGANCSGTPGFAVCNQSIYEFVSGVWLRSGIPLPASLTSANLTDLVGSFFPPANAIVLVGTTAATTSDGWGGLAWSYQGGNWTTAVAGVPDVYGAGFAYVPGLNESVLVGGIPAGASAPEGPQLWGYNGTSVWTNLTPLWNGSAAAGDRLDPAVTATGNGSLLEYGGYVLDPRIGEYAPTNTTFAYLDLGGRLLVSNETVATGPPAVGEAAFATNGSGASGYSLLFGGAISPNGSGSRSSESWVFGGSGSNAPLTILRVYVTPNPINTTTPVRYHVDLASGVAPFQYRWAFGDGTLGSGASPLHYYDAAGTYTASVLVTDPVGQNASGSVNLTVVSGSITPLGLGLWANATLGAAPLDVGFVSNVSGGTPPYTYAWSFGDGGTSGAARPSHVYATAGDYNASVTVTDHAGGSIGGFVTVTVVNGSGLAPSVALVVRPATALPGGSVTVIGTVSGGFGAYSVSWGGELTGCTAQAVFVEQCPVPVAGSFEVSLSVRDALGRVGVNVTRVAVGSTPIPVRNSTASPTGWGQLETPTALAGLGSVVLVALLAGLILARRTRSAPSARPPGEPDGGRGSAPAPPPPPAPPVRPGSAPVREPTGETEDPTRDFV